MEYITNAFRYVLGFSNKKQITGYIVAEDKVNQRTLVMVKEGDRLWVSKWYETNEYDIKPMDESMNHIFIN